MPGKEEELTQCHTPIAGPASLLPPTVVPAGGLWILHLLLPSRLLKPFATKKMTICGLWNRKIQIIRDVLRNLENHI
jgi:hypothetical protein